VPENARRTDLCATWQRHFQDGRAGPRSTRQADREWDRAEVRLPPPGHCPHHFRNETRDCQKPFAKRRGIDPSKLLVTFLASDPSPEARDKVLEIKTDPEELKIDGHEL